MNKLIKLFTAIAATATIATVSAVPVTIDFENDGTGAQANGFSSVDAPGVSFSDSDGADLSLANFGTQGDGNSLGIFGDDTTSFLIIDFDSAATSIEMAFGNDQVFGGNPATDALLEVFMNGALVGSVTVALNLDDIMNQTIAYSGAAFNQATFTYIAADGSIATLIEIVDNITFDAVPTPGSLALISLGLLMLVVRRRK